MVRAKLTRTDGSTLELEGTSEEVAAVLAWETSQVTQIRSRLILTPLPRPRPTASPGPGATIHAP